MKQFKIIKFYFIFFCLSGCANPEKELPTGALINNDWFVEKGNPNHSYDGSIFIKFQKDKQGESQKLQIWEGDEKTPSCLCDGYYSLNTQRDRIKIYGLNNANCPWINSLNGTYIYLYNASRDGYNKFTFKNEKIQITHCFNENR